ncbi:hypothetical protein [Roseovarius aestuarii]|uniref:Uncharacterized protein n=1 Tax=Roseovarius aestuarii TaxID=475083 RepID=A0A1X7BMQ2_9RHOB|nr:hypothetical protein [Roseovarius aestuarii]SMC10814.1 hypothetical protein ROA7745_00621 [Roseovarius aestuarii]
MKQAIVIMHGMGEQIPMSTLNSFVHSVWTTDDRLVDQGKPDPNTGGARSGNTSWAKPDNRNNSTELRRVTTEKDASVNYTDFYEFYWAHLMQGLNLPYYPAANVRNPLRTSQICTCSESLLSADSVEKNALRAQNVAME